MKPDFQTKDNRLYQTFITISDLALVTRPGDGEVEVTVLTGSDGKPVAGPEVTLYCLDDTGGVPPYFERVCVKRSTRNCSIQV